MVGAEVAGDGLGVFRLVKSLFRKADREGLHRPRRLLLHQRDDGRRIDSSGEERAEGNVGDHLLPNRAGQQLLELIGALLG